MTTATTPSIPADSDAQPSSTPPEGTSADAGEGTEAAEGPVEAAVDAIVDEEPVEAVGASAEIKEGLAGQSETIGSMAEGLDAMAIEVGSMRLSVFDVLVVVGVIAFVIILAWVATRICRAAINRMSRLDSTQRLLTEKLSTIIIWAAAFFLGVDLLGIDLTALAVFSGAFGLAIGFGLQKTFGNLISGILLLLDKSIKPGDVISVSDQAGNESVGQIRKIGVRAISVITRDQTEHLIPNENLMINQVVNWSYSSRDVRVKAPVGVSYDSDLKLVSKLLLQAVEETDRILKTRAPRVNIMEFGDSSVNFEVRFWIQDPEEGLTNIRSDVYMRIWELFQEHDIEIPFPQRDLNVRSNDQIDQLIAAVSQRVSQKEA
ncbi:mechanosensitive ion channel [Altererythrobacter sp. RZ02]|uniref:Mechanosensitive ion channel n=1 Tax=Pontixanthobacter rizhaonensis TaxID=2730337 RepID=A0A848QMP8_9SPHN|nr:mechanosensitive ion channel domain-containing protein [Pontixanthobacter rizhaonensis]NMW30826.1 mechanosensitive ion channel [Pontixanthobacter rizhaonensis]